MHPQGFSPLSHGWSGCPSPAQLIEPIWVTVSQKNVEDSELITVDLALAIHLFLCPRVVQSPVLRLVDASDTEREREGRYMTDR